MSDLLVTGFDAFANLQQNVSADVVRALPGAWKRPESLAVAVLPTIYGLAEQRLLELIGRHRPRAVVMFGVARGRREISLERIALNLDDSETADNAEHVRRGQRIAADGPVGYWSTLPLDRMRDRLAQLGVPATISNHAGAFLCNHVFFAARDAIERRGDAMACGFIHLPVLDAEPVVSFDGMVTAVVACLEVVADELEGVDPRHAAPR